jgi:Calcineurin-like phosphoesterase
MRIGLVADVHLSNHKRHAGDVERSLNRRCREGLEVLERAYVLAHEVGCTMVGILGDLTDTSTPGPQLVGEITRIVHESRVKRGVSTLLMVGNHDQQSNEPGDHAMAPYAPLVEDCTVVGEPAIMALGDADLVLVPHSAAAPAPARLAGVLGSLPKSTRRRVLLMHVGVSDDKTPPFLRGSHDSIEVKKLLQLMGEAGVCMCVAGNWHSHGEWGDDASQVVQVGALVPTGWDNPGLNGYGGLTVLEITPEGVSAKTYTLDGPRFIAPRGLDDLKRALGGERPGRLYVRSTVDPADLHEASKLVSRAHEKGHIAAGEVIVEAADRVIEARNAASAARNAATLAAALDRFVSEMPLEPDVQREDVLGKCRAFLKAGGA